MYRIGQSIDIHQLVAGRKLILGGVEIEHERGLLGHSDADVLCHAVIESIIGALGLGDIGKHFSDTDAQYKGISSFVILLMLILKQPVVRSLALLVMKKVLFLNVWLC